ncbi:MAG: hypothetical protein JNG90_06115, partial [Planctomycetaceae bacterium]|nr:hypothetical protein [Planctomycetaceae bacterium]
NCFAQLEHKIPGLEVYNFALPRTGPREYAAQLRREVLAYRPDLIVVLVSVGSDITDELPAPGIFDVRGLRIYQLAATTWGAPSPQRDRAATVVDGPAERLQRQVRSERQLVVCRTPLDKSMRGRWVETYQHLDDLIRQAGRQEVEVVLAAAPSACQVSPSLCAQLQRRLGLAPASVDLELPQRRLASFAAGRDVTWIDLLPSLRQTAAPPFERSGDEFSAAGNQAVAQALEHCLATHHRELATPVAQATPR